MKVSNTFFSQRGYGGIEAFLVGLVIAAVLYVVIYPPKFSKTTYMPGSGECFIDPDDSPLTITSEGKEYVLIKQHAPTVKIEMPIHFDEIAEKVTIEKNVYPIYKAKENEILAAPTTEGGGIYRPLAVDISALRFVDKSSDNDPTYSLTTPGLADLAVFLEKGQPVPLFIQDYCDAGFPVANLTFFQDTYGASFPPLSFNPKDQPTAAGAFPNVEYRLFAYDKKGSFSFAVGTSQRLTIKAPVTFTSGGRTVTYNGYYLHNSPPETITLVNADPTAGDAEIGYRYTQVQNVPLIQPPVDLHQKSPIQKYTEQLEGFMPFQVPPWGWWTPECKPAVYLYPQKEQRVNVQVKIQNGFITYTDPVYPKGGWDVLAKPSGELKYLGKEREDSTGKINYANGVFPYLYYEGKVADEAIEKPTKGYVKSYEELASFFDEILPKLGLNAKETKEFKEYWLKALPYASYYFIGIVPQVQLDRLEPLTITPKQDTTIRVRLYFEALDMPRSVTEPVIKTPTRNGFTVVDWGGMVKIDKDHPFTCIQ
jgi:hypothetical protein